MNTVLKPATLYGLNTPRTVKSRVLIMYFLKAKKTIETVL